MTPELMEAGSRARERMREREASGEGRVARRAQLLRLNEPDFGQGVALYLDDISVSFDGFKALNALTMTINVGELSQEVACGESVTFADLAPGPYMIEEVLDGDETPTGGSCGGCDTCGGTCGTCGGTCDQAQPRPHRSAPELLSGPLPGEWPRVAECPYSTRSRDAQRIRPPLDQRQWREALRPTGGQ